MTESQHHIAQKIANLALDQFERLPSRCKPRQLPNGSREWTPFSAVVLAKHVPNQKPELLLISLGTGTKSLPVSTLPKSHGLILHDCHAEILALRGFNYWLLCEIERTITHNGYKSSWLDGEVDTTQQPQDTAKQPFRMQANVDVHLFSTEAPCGDASMELLIAAAEANGVDTSPWPTSQTPTSAKLAINDQALPPGRGGFAELGALRRKPARADAEVSMSMSCTDKLMMRQMTGLLGFPTDSLLEQVFLKSMVVYDDQYNATGYTRAFSKDGRLKDILAADDKPAELVPESFKIDVLPKDFRRFAFERARGAIEQRPKCKATNTSIVWIAGSIERGSSEVMEVLVNGVKQGYKQFDSKVKKGSTICRYNMTQKALAIHEALDQAGHSMDLASFPCHKMYSELKNAQYRQHRRANRTWILDKLGGWPSSLKDDFAVEYLASKNNDVSSYIRTCYLILYSAACSPFPVFSSISAEAKLHDRAFRVSRELVVKGLAAILFAKSFLLPFRFILNS